MSPQTHRTATSTSRTGRLTRLRVGAHVFHPTRGVSTVVAIEERCVGGEWHEFYILELALGGKVLLPTVNVERSGVRKLISISEARELSRVVTTKPDLDEGSRRERTGGYADALRGGSANGYTHTLRQLLFRSRSNKLSLTERRLLGTARAHFVGEVSLVLGWPAEKLEAMLLSVTDSQS